MMLVWMQRSPLMGHGQNEDLPLLTGIVFVIAVDTGEVLDFHVLSNECHELSIKKSQCQSDEEFYQWQLEHLAADDCDINFTGSSPAMEAEGATDLWNRSVECHNIQY